MSIGLKLLKEKNTTEYYQMEVLNIFIVKVHLYDSYGNLEILQEELFYRESFLNKKQY